MKGLVLAIKDYENHMTPEGALLQSGLEKEGFVLAGYGYGDGCTLVPRLLDRHQPDIVVVQDVRDWHRDEIGCLDKAAHFDGLRWLGRFKGKKFLVVKDAWGAIDRQRDAAETMEATGLITYASKRLVDWASDGWTETYRQIRTWPSIDELEAKRFAPVFDRIVTGARNPNMYPVRELLIKNAHRYGIVYKEHPGYHNRGSEAASFIDTLSQYRVSFATSNKYGFMMAKVIESLVAGCLTVTDTPLEEIPECVREFVLPFDERDKGGRQLPERWVESVAVLQSKAAWQNFNWKAVGARLAGLLEGF